MGNRTRKLLTVGVIAAMTLSMAACTSGNDTSSSSGSTDKKETKAGTGKIGVAMPTKDLQRWNQDGENMKKQLEDAGYEVDLQFASNDVATQVSQVENMISGGCDVLVIGSIDGESLGTPLKQAEEQGIPVVSYDRLIMNSSAVTYYATFDNYLVGQKQGEYIVDALDLDNTDGPYNMEIFTGDPGDNNVNWSTEKAQSRMEAILASNYNGKDLDVVLCSNDSTALGVENALEANYTGKWPVITGQDCDKPNVKNIVNGKQSMSVFKDTRKLAEQTVKMVDAIMDGKEAETNDNESYDNGTGIIPSYLCEPTVVTIDNYEEMLLDSGYYTEADIK